MVSQASIRPYLSQAYLLGLLMMAVGLTLSPLLMSLSQFWLGIVWVVDGVATKSFHDKLTRFWQNKPAVLLVAFYLLHAFGLLYSSDFQFAVRDLRVKLPILVLPFVLSSVEPIDRKRFDLLLQVYVASVFVATILSFSTYLKHDYEDVREISQIISHIRFCLNIVFSMAVVGYYIVKMRVSRGKGVPAFGVKVVVNQFLMWFLFFWFAYQIYIFESLSGYVALAVAILLSAIYVFLRWNQGRAWRIAVATTALGLVAAAVIVVVWEIKPMLKAETVDFKTLDSKTAQGNDYWHDTICHPVEDGKFVGLYYCPKELQETWPKRSDRPLDGMAENGENLEATLIRYLTSKGLRKDAEGLMALTDEDIRNVERGVANYNNWKHPGLRARLSSTLFEYGLYRRYNNPNGGSLSQRIEFTRASFHIIGKHPWFGVGTGDVSESFMEAYNEIQSPLKEEYRFLAHNQYLAIGVAFGLVGLVFFLVVLLYPWCSSRKNRTYLYTVFLGVMLFSMLAEDALDTQAGASLFAFFEALLLFVAPKE